MTYCAMYVLGVCLVCEYEYVSVVNDCGSASKRGGDGGRALSGYDTVLDGSYT